MQLTRHLLSIGLARPSLTPAELADSPQRAELLRIIRAEPGLSTGQLRRRARMSWGTCTYHLRRLAAGGQVVLLRHGPRRFVFLRADRDQRINAAGAALASFAARNVARAVLAGHHDIPSIATRAGISARMAYYHVNALIAAGLVEAPVRSRLRDLRPSPMLGLALAEFGADEGT